MHTAPTALPTAPRASSGSRTVDIRVGPLVLTVHDDDQVLVTASDGEMARDSQHGYFCADTRLVSVYQLRVSGVAPLLLNSAAIRPFSARYEYMNDDLEARSGAVAKGTVHLRVDRTIGEGVHEDYDLTNYNPFPVDMDLEIRVESDFADLFDVRADRKVRRGSLETTWDSGGRSLRTWYHNGPFHRGLRLLVDKNDAPAEYANATLSFRARMEPGQGWHTCLLWEPLLSEDEPGPPRHDCHALLGGDNTRDQLHQQWSERVTRISTSDSAVTAAAERAVADLAALRLQRGAMAAASSASDAEGWVPAGGIPWYVTLFGRDALVVSLQTLALSPRFSLAALEALATLQAKEDDPRRDQEPGKIQHEIRYGEMAALGLIPQTPYYGTHDATTLFVWAASELWSWTGDTAIMARLRPNVEAALGWIDGRGDRDGDGLQEYATRAGDWGYYNQSWKDAGDAIVAANGSKAPLPLATVEMQGYVVAAKRGWARVLEEAFGDSRPSTELRRQADQLAELIEDRYWWNAEGTYYLALDGNKRPVESVASNPGHLLWTGAVDSQRAAQVARRLTAPDMWSGWGVRTLSADHCAYNPFSYQRGSVWPHDNAVFVAGCLRYGLREPAWQVARAILDAADRFQHSRLPELFAGLSRDAGGFPVQYPEANVPQAWAAGAVVHLITALAGLAPDAREHRLQVTAPLPPWMSQVELRGLRLGEAQIDLRLRPGAVDVLRGKGRLDVLGPGETPAPGDAGSASS